MTDKVATTSPSIELDNLAKLRAVFPSFIKDHKIDFDALQAFLKKEGILADEEKYGISWSGKSNAFNAIRTPATGTLIPQKDESKNWDTTGNIFIEGDNLEVLKLLQKHYTNPGTIKMIYIDPPYNTGKDFVYRDNFHAGVADYYETTGQTQGGIKMTANTEKNGRYHSDWLTMMYPRLFLARNLLRDDGVIFVSIDDNEVANLRLIMDEIFGEENFFGQITWQNRTKPKNIGGSKYSLQQNVEYILVYGKFSSDKFNFKLPETSEKIYPEIDSNGEYRLEEIQQRKNLGSMRRDSMVYELLGVLVKENYRWQLSPDKKDELISKSKLIRKGKMVYKKIYKVEETGFSYEPFWSHRTDTGTAESAKEDLEVLMGIDDIFDTVKPTDLIKQLLYFLPDDSIILDFFAGSGTTAHAVMDLNAVDDGNRKWICVQLPELTTEDSEAYKAGYKNIADIARDRIRKAGDKIGKGDIGFKSFKLTSSNYRRWTTLTDTDDKAILIKQTKLFLDKPLTDNYKEEDVVYEILLKEGFNLHSVVTTEKKDSLTYYQILDGERKMIVSFAPKITQKDIDSLKLLPDTTFVCLDSAIDDTTKVNISRALKLKVI